MVERMPEEHGVGSSILPLGTVDGIRATERTTGWGCVFVFRPAILYTYLTNMTYWGLPMIKKIAGGMALAVLILFLIAPFALAVAPEGDDSTPPGDDGAPPGVAEQFTPEKASASCCPEGPQYQQDGSPLRVCICNPLGPHDVDLTYQLNLIGRVASSLVAPIGALAFGAFIVGGLYWVFSGGQEEKIKRGRDIMIWSLVGLVVVFSSYALITFVFKVFGI